MNCLKELIFGGIRRDVRAVRSGWREPDEFIEPAIENSAVMDDSALANFCRFRAVSTQGVYRNAAVFARLFFR
jgi:hypothetical protein